jgi:glucose/arabinose dehydrogenase
MLFLLDSRPLACCIAILVLIFCTVASQYCLFAQVGKDTNADSRGYIIQESNLKIETVTEGLEFPTTMAFVGPDDILVLEKNKGHIKRIVEGSILEETLLNLSLVRDGERGMLGIAVANSTQNDTTHTYVFIYFTQSKKSNDAVDRCPPPEPYYCKQENEPVGNRLYRYELVNDKLSKPELLLDLPARPGPNHNGGVVLIGPDENIYTVIGDLTQRNRSQAQNIQNGSAPDGTSGILRITESSNTFQNRSFGQITSKYYAYGIRNSFGIDFDPVTGHLWDTENGPAYGDYFILVRP